MPISSETRMIRLNPRKKASMIAFEELFRPRRDRAERLCILTDRIQSTGAGLDDSQPGRA